MHLRGTFRILASLALLAMVLPVVAGCAGVGYWDRSTLSQTRYATVENFGDEEITAEQVDGLLEEVAAILDVTLDRSTPKVRIMVRPSSQIAALYRQTVTIAGHGAEARALYFTSASLVVIPYYNRTILGHELAHYLTDHYLKSTPRRHWERIARMVEDALPVSAPVARRPSPADAAARATIAPLLVPAN
jgi:hypothetical protein